jgi:hypothetical protein
MPLYLVQDADRPLWVVAESWQAALKQWQKQIAVENATPDNLLEAADNDPQGILRICDNDELLIYGILQQELPSDLPPTKEEKTK